MSYFLAWYVKNVPSGRIPESGRLFCVYQFQNSSEFNNQIVDGIIFINSIQHIFNFNLAVLQKGK